MEVQENSSMDVEMPFRAWWPVEVATMPSVRTVAEVDAISHPSGELSTCIMQFCHW
jgi:hypothetical protein